MVSTFKSNRKATACLALAAGLFFSSNTLLLAQDGDRFAKVKITTEKVSDNLYVLFGAGGNIGVSVGEDGIYLIDDQYAPLSGRILDALKILSDQSLRYVISTHWHGDHTGGNENMAQAGGQIIAHDNVRIRMRAGSYIKAFDMQVAPAKPEALAVITYSDAMSLHLNGEEARIKHVENSHTDGDSMVWFRASNVVYMGDTFFNLRYPLIDLSSGGSVDGVINVATATLSQIDDQTIIVPGHGPVTNKAGLKAYRDMLVTLQERVSALKTTGKTKDAVIAANPSVDFDDVWSTNDSWRDLFIGIIYDDV